MSKSISDELGILKFKLKRELDKWDRVELDHKDCSTGDYMEIEFMLDKLAPAILNLIDTKVNEAKAKEVLIGKINELKDLKNYMISTSPFISEILEPRIEMLENRLATLKSKENK